jgi:hypothetical protein
VREDSVMVGRWSAAAEEIHADICTNALDRRGIFTQHYDTDALDASVLLMPLVRFLPPDDPRIHATVLAIAEELAEEGLVLRYRTEEIDDGLVGEEGTSRSAPSGSSRRSARSAGSAPRASCSRSCSPTPARCSYMPRRSTRART